jgi:two-component system, NarL family, response regulator
MYLSRTMPSRDPIRILLVDDHAIVRDGLAAILEFQSDMTVVAHAADGEAAVMQFRLHEPDLVLMDLAMPRVNGVQATTAIKAEYQDARIIVLTTYDGDESIYRALECGAKGYLLKDCTTQDLFSAIRSVHQGGTHIAPHAAARLAQRVMLGPSLSPRELDVLALIAKGKSNKETAGLLFISEGTVKTHVLSIYEKLRVRDRTEAVITAMKRGIIQG